MILQVITIFVLLCIAIIMIYYQFSNCSSSFLAIVKENMENVPENTFYFNATTDYGSFFPEMAIYGNNGIGIGISGGGVRSYLATIGYFRALTNYGYDPIASISTNYESDYDYWGKYSKEYYDYSSVLGRFDKINLIQKNICNYISTVSGGSWFYGIYSFAQYDSEVLLGRSCDIFEGKISEDDIYTKNLDNSDFMGNRTLHHKYSMRSLDSWETSVSRVYLSHYKINDKIVCLNNMHKDRLASLLPEGSKIIVYDSYIPKKPFFICNTSIGYEKFSFNFEKYTTVIFTPFYTGIPYNIIDNKINYGGVIEDTCIFGRNKLIPGNKDWVTPSKFNTLTTMISKSSSFMGAAFSETLGITPAIDQFYLLKRSQPLSQEGDFILKPIIDGGALDNLGLLSLLSRDVKKILLLVNNAIVVTPTIEDIDDIIAFFGLGKGHTEMKVFEEKDYHNIIKPQFYQCVKLGLPLFARANLRVLQNYLFGVRGDFYVDVIFVVLNNSDVFNNFLPKKIVRDFCHKATSGALEGLKADVNMEHAFPNLSTFALSTNISIVNLISTYTEWTLRQPHMVVNIFDLIKDEMQEPPYDSRIFYNIESVDKSVIVIDINIESPDYPSTSGMILLKNSKIEIEMDRLDLIDNDITLRIHTESLVLKSISTKTSGKKKIFDFYGFSSILIKDICKIMLISETMDLRKLKPEDTIIEFNFDYYHLPS